MNCSMEQPAGNRCAHGARAACVSGHCTIHGTCPGGAIVTVSAEAGRSKEQQTFVLPTTMGSLWHPVQKWRTRCTCDNPTKHIIRKALRAALASKTTI